MERLIEDRERERPCMAFPLSSNKKKTTQRSVFVFRYLAHLIWPFLVWSFCTVTQTLTSKETTCFYTKNVSSSLYFAVLGSVPSRRLNKWGILLRSQRHLTILNVSCLLTSLTSVTQQFFSAWEPQTCDFDLCGFIVEL